MADRKDDMGGRRPRRWPAAVGAFVAIGFVLPAIIAFSTPWPAMVLIARPLFDRPLSKGALVSRALAQVEIGVPRSFAVAGAPAASLTFIRPRAAADTPRPLILWVHGGGWSAGNAEQMNGYLSVLAAKGYVIANLDYALAPEHLYPTAIRQGIAALDFVQREAARHGGDPHRIFLGGDSAGAQIAGQLATMVSNPRQGQRTGIPVSFPASSLRGVILYCGVYDIESAAHTGFPAMNSFLWAYTGEREYRGSAAARQMNVSQNVTDRFPPTYITDGDGDPLEPQSYQLDAVLRARGVAVTSRYWTWSGRGLPHEYQFDLGTAPGQVVLNDVAAFLEHASS